MKPTTSFRGFQSSVATLGIALAGCADPAPTPHELGIAKIERTESPTELTLVGVDAQGGEIARVHLRLGLVDMSSEDRGVLDGREMTAEVLGKLATHQSAGRGTPAGGRARETWQLFQRCGQFVRERNTVILSGSCTKFAGEP